MGGRSRWAAAGVVAGVIAGGGAALAASGGASSVIHACYSKQGGALRVAAHCRRGERAIAWNKVGLRGPAGAPGRNGTNGRDGTNGSNGHDGLGGLPGSARAYAFVNGNAVGVGHQPTFDTARTKGFSAVTEPQNGVYCLTAPGVDPSATAAVVGSVYASGFADTPTDVQLISPNITCPAGEFEVSTKSIVLTNSGTHLSESDTPNLSFTIAVP